MNGGIEKRDSRALEPQLVVDELRKAEIEALNGLRQYDAGMEVVRSTLDGRPFRLRPSLVLMLHREALQGLSMYAGNFRPGGVEIQGSKHQPPPAHLVPELIEEMCDYVTDGWDRSSPIHLAAYLMWRLNWIHPFADGNGRTSRILSYVVLSIRAQTVLPGTPTIPDQIVARRSPYFEALDAADAAWEKGRIDVSAMEELLSGMLAVQLKSFYDSAGGRPPETG